MKRILAIDYGVKRCGLAVTDPLQIAAHPLTALPTEELEAFLERYLKEEDVETIVFGEPVHADGTPTAIKDPIDRLIKRLQEKYPDIAVDFQDEAFTSAHARDVILRSGAGRKKRRDKSLVDKVSAVLILQLYLKHI